MKSFDFTQLSGKELYPIMISAIVPRPIAWISTLNTEGSVNLAPFSFFNAVSSQPPCLMVSITRKRDKAKKDTLMNIERNKEFVVHIAGQSLAEQVNETSAELDYGQSEVTRAGLHTQASFKIKTPRIIEAPIAMECTLEKIVWIGEDLGSSALVIGRIVMLHAQDDLIENGEINFAKLQPLSRLGGILYGKTSDTFEIARPKT